jgi:hypothetical protein
MNCQKNVCKLREQKLRLISKMTEKYLAKKLFSNVIHENVGTCPNLFIVIYKLP